MFSFFFVLITPFFKAVNPSFTNEELTDLLSLHYNIIPVSFYPFDSYQDQNVLITTQNNTKYVIKVSNINEKLDPLAFQTTIMKLLSEIPSLKNPKLIPAVDNRDIILYKGHLVRVIEYVEGVLYVKALLKPSPELFYK